MENNFYQFKATSLQGKEISMDTYKGKVALVVNTASQCGLTPQYEGLEKLYEKYRDQGLVVAGFPANDFAGQEPGTNEEIQAFCKSSFSVEFPVFEKLTVAGANKHPLYRALTKAQPR